jgi:lysyl endopeptidase
MNSMNRHIACGAVAGVLSVLMALAAAAQTVQEPPARVEAITQPAHAAVAASPFKVRGPGAATPQAITLPAVALHKALAQVSASPRPGTPRKVGFGRDIAALATAAAMASHLNWQDTAEGGRITAITIALPQATGARLGVLVSRLPKAAILRVSPMASGTVFEISGQVMLETLQRNVDGGDESVAARTFWTPYVQGEQATLEVELPPGVDPDALEIAMPRVTQFFASPYAASAQASSGIGASGSCEVDASCYSTWNDAGNATAKMSFVDVLGDGYICSGTLLNNKAADFTPYFLSANHCIANQTEASSLQTFWFYRSSACNSGVLNSATQTLTGGASLLYASSTTDTSFMKLNGSPPAGAVYSAWSVSAAPSPGALVTGVHHPEGDLQKISFGSLRSYLDCTVFSDRVECYGAYKDSASHFEVGYTTGITEPGSSGSGLYSTIGGAHYLVGQLTGGNSTCNNQTGTEYYGRLDQAYNAKLKLWLDGVGCPEKAVYRYRNTNILGHFYTTSTAEGSALIAGGAPLQYEGVAFTACGSGSTSDGIFPVYRFKHLVQNGVYFYSMLPEEISFVRTSLSHLLKDEGIAYYAYNANASGRYPMYRFRNTTITGANFYTILEAERANVVANVPGYAQEGIGFYALPPR